MPQDRNEERHRVQKQGRYRTGNGVARDVMVTDLSTNGCRFFDKFCNLTPGMVLTLRVGNVGPLDADVRWVDDFTVGVQFRSPIHQSVLDHMRTTIEGWRLPDVAEGGHPFIKAASEPATRPRSDLGEETFNLIVRPASAADVRQVLLDAGISLPITSYSDLVDVFHRVLTRVAKETK